MMNNLHTHKRRLLQLALTGIGLAGMLGTAIPADATSTALDGGLGCYGSGASAYDSVHVIIGAATNANEVGCGQFGQVYLEALTPPGYADYPGTWGYTAIAFFTGATSVVSTHNLCYFTCNGYVGTYAP